MEHVIHIVEMGGDKVQQMPPKNNPYALDLRELQWEDDCIELEFEFNLHQKSFSIKEILDVEPSVEQQIFLDNAKELKDEEEEEVIVEDPEEKALRLTRENVFDKILKQNDPKKSPEPQESLQFEELQILDEICGVISNREPFDCLICFNLVEVDEGIMLRDCLHLFCRECLKDHIAFSEDAMIKCPFIDGKYSCDSILRCQEVRALVSETTLEKILTRGLQIAEGVIENTYHCKTADCIGFCEYVNGARLFLCQNCDKINCIACDVIHGEIDCDVYQVIVKKTTIDDLSEKAMEEALANGSIMRCPGCKVFLEKMTGCDYLVCFVCNTEICWVTKKPRRGPDGCGCLPTKKCHPNCGNCH